MVLQKQLVPVNFQGGLDTKTAAELVQPGSFLVLENCVRQKGQLVQKRYGFQALGTNLIGSGPAIESGTTLALFQNDLVLLNQTNIYSYVEASNKWVNKGDLTVALISQVPIVRDGFIEAMPDSAALGGFTVSAWEGPMGGVYYSVIDNSTDTIIVSDFLLNAAADRAKCITLGSHTLITYISGGALIVRRISITDTTSISGESTVASPIQDLPYDLNLATPTAAIIAFNSGGAISVAYLLESGLLGSPLSGYPALITLAQRADDAISVAVDQVNHRNYITYAYSGNTSDVQTTALNSDFTIQQTAALVLPSPYDSDIRNIASITRDVNIYIYCETPVAGDVDSSVQPVALTWDGVSALATASTLGPAVHSVGLATQAFFLNDVIYYIAAFDTPIQPTYFMINEKAEIVAKILANIGNGLTKDVTGALKSGLTHVIPVSEEIVNFPLPVRTQVQAADDGTVLATNVGLDLTSATIGSTPFVTDTLGSGMLIAGGTVQSYDGVSITEHGFHVYPENTTIALGPDGAGVFPALGSPPNQYTYAVTYEWTDAQGQIFRSAPSVALSEDISATTNTIVLQIPRCRLTAKIPPRSPVQIVVYRGTENDPTILYRLRSINNLVSVTETNVVKTEDLFTYTDDNTDGTDLAIREVLYTTGGVVDNIAPPASKVVHKHKNRMWLGGLEDATKIVFSNYWQFQEGVNFSDELPFVRVDQLGGDVTALASLDDKLVIFKADRTYTITGDGPDDTGAQNDYPDPQLVSGDVGTMNQNSIVITPMGLMFQSGKGIYLLSRALETVYIGAPVEEFNDQTVTSAVMLDDANEVRFTTAAGPTLVYNYYFQQWSVFTNYASNSAIVALDTYLHLDADGTVQQELPDTWQDNGSMVSMSFETSWFSFANMQGFQRVYWIAMLGEFFSHHFSKIELAYDFENAYSETVYFNTVTGLMQTTYGTGVYGEESPYGGTGSGVYEWRLKPRRQRCTSLKLRISDIDTITPNGGASFALVNLAFVVGLLSGVNRLGPNKTI